jgi:hypothetical protein
MYYATQFRDLIARTLSEWPELSSPSAVALLMGTASQESQLGTFLRQLGGGPAVGPFQMEPATFDWLKSRFGKEYGFTNRDADDMEWDLRLSILLARLRYRVVPDALPEAHDLHGQAAYWKRWYNTPQGAGTVAEYQSNYRKRIGEV